MCLVARTVADPLSMASALRGAIRTVDADLPVYRVRTMEQVLADSVAQPRLTTLTLGIFAALALTLAVVGLYGVMSYAVTQRTHEVAIRMALGAQRWDVLALILKQGLKLTLLGSALGVGAALVLTRWMENLLFARAPNRPADVWRHCGWVNVCGAAGVLDTRTTRNESTSDGCVEE